MVLQEGTVQERSAAQLSALGGRPPGCCIGVKGVPVSQAEAGEHLVFQPALLELVGPVHSCIDGNWGSWGRGAGMRRRTGKRLGQAWDGPGPVAAAEFGDTEEPALCR